MHTRIPWCACFCCGDFELPVDEGEGILNTDRARHSQPVRCRTVLANPEAGFIRQPPVPAENSINKLLHGKTYLLEGHRVRSIFVIVVHRAAEKGRVPVWPVKLVEVNVICL
eukprot:scaffold55_cov401-Prasinococcus_capsulatus_cf.AAC.8